VEVVASLSQGGTAAAQCGLFTHKSVPVIFEPPCTYILEYYTAYSNTLFFAVFHPTLIQLLVEYSKVYQLVLVRGHTKWLPRFCGGCVTNTPRLSVYLIGLSHKLSKELTKSVTLNHDNSTPLGYTGERGPISFTCHHGSLFYGIARENL